MEDRPYQKIMTDKINEAWAAGSRAVLGVLPTGGGKTHIFSNILLQNQGKYALAMAHRKELVEQMSLSLAKRGVKHSIYGPKEMVRDICSSHISNFNTSFVDQSSKTMVASVDTINSRGMDYDLRAKITLCVTDEAHHVLQSNKWGKASLSLPNARFLGVTASPKRADRKGLGSHADGLYDSMVLGPSMRELIDMGYLSDYRIVEPRDGLDMSGRRKAADGDYSDSEKVAAVRSSPIIGDIVTHYIKWAYGKKAIIFMPDVATCFEIADRFTDAGIAAKALSGKTPRDERVKAITAFRSGALRVLVNVGLFGEGFDVPDCEVVILGSPTASLAKYLQEFGRGLRTSPGKQWALIIDHVGNRMRHGLPDLRRVWSLDKEYSANEQERAVIETVCSNTECRAVYFKHLSKCPYCGAKRVKATVQAGDPIEYLEGDLTELSREDLRRMREEVDKSFMSPDEYKLDLIARHCPDIGVNKNVRAYTRVYEKRVALRENIAIWGAKQRLTGAPDSESYRLFYNLYGVDVLSALCLPEKMTDELNEKILAYRSVLG